MTEENVSKNVIDFIMFYRNKGFSDKWILNRFNIFLNQILFEENMYQFMLIK